VVIFGGESVRHHAERKKYFITFTIFLFLIYICFTAHGVKFQL